MALSIVSVSVAQLWQNIVQSIQTASFQPSNPPKNNIILNSNAGSG